MNKTMDANTSWKWPITALLIVLVFVAGWKIIDARLKATDIQSFQDCVQAGYPVLQSFPEQCIANGQTFVNTR